MKESKCTQHCANTASYVSHISLLCANIKPAQPALNMNDLNQY